MTAQEHPGPGSQIRRGRGRSAATNALATAAYEVLDASTRALTVRQVFYRLVARGGAIPKTEAAYTKLKRLLTSLREEGVVPWSWVVDNTRITYRSPWMFDTADALLEDAKRLYCTDLMRQQNVAIQVWAESDSIASVLYEATDPFTVPLFVGRGYTSVGYVWSAAEDAVAARRQGKTVHILHVGDYDPSGLDIYRDLTEKLSLYAAAIQYRCSAAEMQGRVIGSAYSAMDLAPWLSMERLALTPEQIAAYDLPTAPPKSKDTRSRTFRGAGTVEVEALDDDVLVDLVTDAIESIIDPVALDIARVAEESERDILARMTSMPAERLAVLAEGGAP